MNPRKGQVYLPQWRTTDTFKQGSDVGRSVWLHCRKLTVEARKGGRETTWEAVTRMEMRDHSPKWSGPVAPGLPAAKFLQIVVFCVCLMGSDKRAILSHLISSWQEVEVPLIKSTTNCNYISLSLQYT